MLWYGYSNRNTSQRTQDEAHIWSLKTYIWIFGCHYRSWKYSSCSMGEYSNSLSFYPIKIDTSLTVRTGYKKPLFGRDLQDGRRVRRGDHLPPHKYIRNSSTCGTAPIEYLLNAGRRPQTSPKARNSPRTWVGQKKKQRQKNRDGTCPSGRELWRRKSFHTLGSPFTGGDGGWQGGSFRATEESAATGCGGQSGEIPAQRIRADQHSPAREAWMLTHWGGRGLGAEARALEVGSQGEDWGWQREHSLKGLAHHS